MSFNKLKFGSTIGIIGGGQLGKNDGTVRTKMGFKVIVLDPNEDSPCHMLHINLFMLIMTTNKH